MPLIGSSAKLKPQSSPEASISEIVAVGVSPLIAFAVAKMGATDESSVNHGVELIGTNIFAALFFVSSGLFRRAALVHSSSSS